MPNRNSIFLFCVNVIGVLFFAGLFYVIFAPDVYLVHKLAQVPVISEMIDGLWSFADLDGIKSFRESILFLFVRNYMLDAAWSYALVFTFYMLFSNEARGMWIAFVIGCTWGIAMEVGQLLGWLSGTFDILDIVVEILGAMLALWIIQMHRRTSI